MNGARNIFENGAYINGFGEIEPQWPIFYSLSLVPSYFIGVPVQIFSRLLNVFYFIGGCYFFYCFLKRERESSALINLVITLSLGNYYAWRSVFLEMPDITLFFLFNAFLYASTFFKDAGGKSKILCFTVTLVAVLTKPTGLVFLLACFFNVIFSLFYERKNLGKGVWVFLASLAGFTIGKLINSQIIKSMVNQGFPKIYTGLKSMVVFKICLLW